MLSSNPEQIRALLKEYLEQELITSEWPQLSNSARSRYEELKQRFAKAGNTYNPHDAAEVIEAWNTMVEIDQEKNNALERMAELETEIRGYLVAIGGSISARIRVVNPEGLGSEKTYIFSLDAGQVKHT